MSEIMMQHFEVLYCIPSGISKNKLITTLLIQICDRLYH